MNTNVIVAVFADFNDLREEPQVPQVEEVLSINNETVDQAREEAWTDGYLTARQAPVSENEGMSLTAKLVTALDQLDDKAEDAVDAASMVVADLLVNAVVAAASASWPSDLLCRVRTIANKIKPALTVEPEFVLRDSSGTERRFADIASLTTAFDDEIIGEDVTIKWKRGEAAISRLALLEDLQEAVIPLSAGLVNEQDIRKL